MIDVTTQISRIVNTMSASDTSFSDDETIHWQTSTTYDQVLVPTNPYCSNYKVVVDFDQFNRPEVISWVGLGDEDPSFSYVSNDPDIDEQGWVYQSDTYWFYVKYDPGGYA